MGASSGKRDVSLGCRLARKGASPLAAVVPSRLRRHGSVLGRWDVSLGVGSRASAPRRSLRSSHSGSAVMGASSGKRDVSLGCRLARKRASPLAAVVPFRLRRHGSVLARPRIRAMIRRIDLRGRTPDDYREVVPRADIDVDAAVEWVRPICDAVRTRGVEAIRELSERFDGVARRTAARPRRGSGPRPGRARPGGPAGLEESIRRLRATCEAELEHDRHHARRGRTVTHRMVPVAGSGSTCPVASRRWSPAW
jgi:hypothetical protein